jgi:hypothetical protein
MTFSRAQIMEAHHAAAESGQEQPLQRMTTILAEMVVADTASVDKNSLADEDRDLIQRLLEPGQS